ncbi:hypothetical protein LCGC14_3046070 [marine sediment metagenome]|uniref:Uncharacterized protein n=1 Tax=marine sediment metagenome TaxID=412755 RepID=A0A0F8XBC7_9ZZZZ
MTIFAALGFLFAIICVQCAYKIDLKDLKKDNAFLFALAILSAMIGILCGISLILFT